jgi:preprotein translocase subunit SecE
VARDRQRAKQRKQRREPTPPKRDEGNGVTPDPRPLHRENVPGSVEHTGDVDEFEAALVAGADGEPETDPDAVDRASLGEVDEVEPVGAESIDEAQTGDVEAPPPPPGTRTAPHPGEDAHGRGGSRFLNFLRACWAELQRVQWPDRRQVGQATLVVLGFVLVAGAFLGFADYVAERLVDFII